MWGETKTLVSGSGSSGYAIPDGWTSTGTVEGGSYLKFDEGTITSPEFAPHTGLSFTYSVATFGSGTNHPLTIRILNASTDAVIVEKTTATPTSSTYINTNSPLSLGDIDVAFKIELYGPTGKGVRLRNYSITGTPVGAALTAIATEVSITDPGTLTKGATGAFSASSTDAAACTKAWSSSDASVIEIKNAATGAYEAKGRGTAKITYTITPDDAKTYSTVSSYRNISVTEPVVITASDVNMTYGDDAKAIGATTSAGYAGTLSYLSGNTNIATVDESGNVTAVAVGKTTITISASADAGNFYAAGDAKEINVTVNAQAGSVEALSSEQTIFNETFNTNTGTGGNDDTWNGSIASATFNSDNSWTVENAKGADRCAKFGTSSSGGSATTPDIDLEDGVLYTLTFKAGAWDKSGEGTSLSVSAKNATIRNEANTADVSSVTMSLAEWTSYTLKLIITDDSKPANITFSSSSGNNRFFLDEVKVTKHVDPTIAVKLNASGYATLCSQYPLDFTTTDGYTAWQITNVDGEIITFSKITGTIKGGQGILLKGTENATINIPSSDSSTSLSDNKLVGTLAPTYAAADQYYGLSSNQFVKVNAGTVPAGKALLPASLVSVLASRLTFVFEGEATGIQNVNVNANLNKVYDLQGRRVAQPKQGLYIKGGKKYVVK